MFGDSFERVRVCVAFNSNECALGDRVVVYVVNVNAVVKSDRRGLVVNRRRKKRESRRRSRRI